LRAADEPDPKDITVEDGASLETILRACLVHGGIPQFQGGMATWSVTSSRVIAVVAQQWVEPWLMDSWRGPARIDRWDVRGGVLHLHWNYHGKLDPALVKQVLFGFSMRSP
jgi:hypothetical protein